MDCDRLSRTPRLFNRMDQLRIVVLGRPEVIEDPRLLFEFWMAWQATPAELPEQSRAALAAEALASRMKVSAREVLIMKQHFELVLSPKAFTCSPVEHTSGASSSKDAETETIVDIIPSCTCPLASEDDATGKGHEIRTSTSTSSGKRGKGVSDRATHVRLFTMKGVRRARACKAECSCGVQLRTSTWRRDSSAKWQWYADVASRDVFASTRCVCWERDLLAWLGVLLERSQVAFRRGYL